VLTHLINLRDWYVRSALDRLLQERDVEQVLDAGCGRGQLAHYLATRHPRLQVRGIDVAGAELAEAAALARWEGLDNLTFEPQDLMTIEMVEEFDLILCGSVLEHVPDDRDVLRRFRRALRPEGSVLLYVPTAARRILPWFAARERALEREHGGDLHGHVREYNVERFRRRVEEAGFTPGRVTVTYGWPGALAYEIVKSLDYWNWGRLQPLRFWTYYALVHPWVLLLMAADYWKTNRKGNGVLLVAHRT
jgi:SAM-dependent methyltransferase